MDKVSIQKENYVFNYFLFGITQEFNVQYN